MSDIEVVVLDDTVIQPVVLNEGPPGATGVPGPMALGDLTDVGAAIPTNRHTLFGDGDSFESRAVQVADLPAGTPDGLATLDSSGKVPTAQLPAIAITDVFQVASQAAMLALAAEKGDVAVRSDVNKSFVLSTNSPSTLADWIELRTPTDTVLSVFGRTGVVTAQSGDYNVGQVTGAASQSDLDVLDTRVDLEESATINHETRIGALESAEPAPTTAVGTYLVSGATVAWVTGFTYRIGAAIYYIDGTAETSVEQNVVLDAAHPTNPRIDVLVLNTAGGAASITGTPNANPAEPSVDPSLFLKLGVVLVPAAAAAAPVTDTPIWKEDTGTDWAAAPSGSQIVIASTNVPRSGIKSIEGTSAAAGSNVIFTIDSGSIDLAGEDKLLFYIQNKAAWPNQKAMRVQWQVGNVPVGAAVTIGNNQFGFQRSVTGSYQQIVVPLSAFSVPAGSAVTKLKWEIVGSGSSVGFYLDDMILQAGISGGGSASQYRWRGAWDSAAAYSQNDEVTRSGATYLALQPNTNQDPATATTYWVKTGSLTGDIGIMFMLMGG